MKVLWEEKEDALVPVVVDGKRREEAAWAFLPGSQEAFLSSPVYETLYEGTRGPGKSISLLMDFVQEVSKGYGAEWRGVLFRRTYPELADVIAKSLQWFPRMKVCRGAAYNRSNHTWTFADGETLAFRYFNVPEDYWGYHGHCVPGGDVLTEHGWVRIQDVQPGMRVLSVWPDGHAERVVVEGRTVQQFDGELVRYAGRGRFMEFTPGHKLPIVDGPNSHRLVPYSEAGRHFEIRTAGWTWTGQGTGAAQVPRAERLRSSTPDPNPMELSELDFAEFLGWYLSDGWVLKHGKNLVGIAQSRAVNGGKFSHIRALLSRIGLHFNENKNGFVWRSKSWAGWLRPLGGAREKFIPRAFVEAASREQLRRFLDAFIDGDGTRQGGRLYAFTCSPKLADDLSEVGVRLGYSVYTSSRQRAGREAPSFQVCFNPRPSTKLYSDNRERRRALSEKTQVERIPFHGLVYCLAVPGTHSFFIRQNGSVWLSGNSYPWIGWDELTTWPSDGCYRSMFACSRSTVAGIPRKVRSTTNPYGVGHNWVKARWRLPIAGNRTIGPVIRDSVDRDGKPEPERVAIRGMLDENTVLMKADPEYKSRIRAAARNPAEAAAWLEDDWDIVAGGMFDDVWDSRTHVVPDVPLHVIPPGWYLDRTYDHGQSRPFVVLWWAESNGEPFDYCGYTYGKVRGDLYLVAEWYGWSRQPNEGLRLPSPDIGRGVRQREMEWELAKPLNGNVNFWSSRVLPGSADSSIFDRYDGEKSVAGDMKNAAGVEWKAADKGPGSRKQGWEQIRKMLKAGREPVREDPGLFVMERCEQWRRTVPTLPRDSRDQDDVDTEAEDHAGDATRYRLRSRRREVRAAAPEAVTPSGR